MPQVEDHNKAFNRLIASSGPSSIKKKRKDRKKSPRGNDRSSGDDNSSFSDDGNDGNASTSSSDSNTYFPGFLDDPQMVQGRHRHVMIGKCWVATLKDVLAALESINDFDKCVHLNITCE